MAGEVGFQLTEADYVAASRDALRDRLSGRNAGIATAAWAITVPLGLLAALAYAFGWSTGGRADLLLPLLLLAVPSIYWFARLGAYFGTSRAARRLFRQHEALRQPIRYSWSGVGFGLETPDGSGLIPWPELQRWRCARHTFLIIADERTVYFIPRAAFADGQADDLEATLLAANVPGPARLEDGLIYA